VSEVLSETNVQFHLYQRHFLVVKKRLSYNVRSNKSQMLQPGSLFFPTFHMVFPI